MGKKGREFTSSMAQVRPRTSAKVFNIRTPTNSGHRYTSPAFRPTNGVRKKAIEKARRPARKHHVNPNACSIVVNRTACIMMEAKAAPPRAYPISSGDMALPTGLGLDKNIGNS